jgi:hypothetical protein
MLVAGPSAAWQVLIVDASRLRDERKLPLPPDDTEGKLWLALVLLGLVMLFVASWRNRGRPASRLVPFFALGLFGLGLMPELLQRADHPHLAVVSLVPVSMLPVSLAAVAAAVPARRQVVLAVGATAIAMLLLVGGTFADYARGIRDSANGKPDSYAVRANGRAFKVVSQGRADQISAALQDVDAMTQPGDRIFVGPQNLRQTLYSDAFEYFLQPSLVPATRFIDMHPAVALRSGRELADDLASADVAILTTDYASSEPGNESSHLGPSDAADVLDNQFCLYGDHGSVRVYRRC